MAERLRADVRTVPIGTDLSTALAQYLVKEYRDDRLGLAKVLLLLPNNRAVSAMTSAFVREAEQGLMLPRMVAIGDLALDEKLGPVLDPLGGNAIDIAPAVGDLEQLMLLTELVRRRRPDTSAAEALHLARQLGQTLAELEVEEKSIADISVEHGAADLAEHWASAYENLKLLCRDASTELEARRLLAPAARRNKLLRALTERLAMDPPATPVIAAGVTTAAPAIAHLLSRIAGIPQCFVLLPHVDCSMSEADWHALGSAAPLSAEAETNEGRKQESHPQFHLKLLLHRMGVARAEVEPLLAGDEGLSRQMRDVFCIPDRTVEWQALPARRRVIDHVRVIEAEDSAEEARAIAVLIRGAVEVPGKRVALVTPDREIAQRVSAQLRRWGIEADDSAGALLVREPEGRLFLAVSQMIAQDFGAVPLLAVLKHPLVAAGDGRLAWLDKVRALDLALRGPQMETGCAAISAAISARISVNRAEPALHEWWDKLAAQIQQQAAIASRNLRGHLEAVTSLCDMLTNGRIWRSSAGRALADLVDNLGSQALDPLSDADAGAIPDLLETLLSDISIRRPYGLHPRVAIYGLLEARLQSADLIVCSGLNEGTWPQLAKPDPWLAPHLRRRLDMPGLDRAIGLSAHDLASAMGAPEVVLTRAKRDRSGPTIASRFLLRLQALFGSALRNDDLALEYARMVDQPVETVPWHKRPQPRPSAAQRRVAISITQMDMLRADPYAFYARNILKLDALKSIAAQPDAAWKGTLVHKIIEDWTKLGQGQPDGLVEYARTRLSDMAVAPALRLLWQPRIIEGMQWIAGQIALNAAEGRLIAASEVKTEGVIAGIKIHGRIDRIDRCPDGRFVVVDYKTGEPPPKRKVNAGYALQLGLAGFLLETGGIKDMQGEAAGYEYWSLGKQKGRFGYVASPVSAKPKPHEPGVGEFASFAEDHARDAIDRWIVGDHAFDAKLRPEYALFKDYDQLMRLDEWLGRTDWEETGNDR